MSTTSLPTPLSSPPILKIDNDELACCVGCGLCLPHCPTFRVTQEEAYSPRGRIATIRSIQWSGLTIDAEVADILDTCVQCRGCEPACPSGVPYGHLIEGAKIELAKRGLITPWWQRLALALLPHHRLLVIGTPFLALAQRLHLIPKRWGLTRVPLRVGPAIRTSAMTSSPAQVIQPHVWLYTGCVMDVWQRSTHRSTALLIESAGSTFAIPDANGSCCGALHSHAGLVESARDLARKVMLSMPGDGPIIVDSAGCGATLKNYGHLLDTDQAHLFSRRVFDIHEWLEPHADVIFARLPQNHQRFDVIVQDPCHLRHVQKVHGSVRALLGRVANVIEVDDDGLCCGAGGSYSITQPQMATKIRQRKVGHIHTQIHERKIRADTLVASANPGCSMHLGAVGLNVQHPVDILARVLGPTPGAASINPDLESSRYPTQRGAS